MSENLKFKYKKEFWYISAFINKKKGKSEQTRYNEDEGIEIIEKSNELEEFVRKCAKNLTDEDLSMIAWNPELVTKVKEMGQNIDVSCRWIPHLEYFPYYHENTYVQFNELGSFEFEVKYHEKNPEKKGNIDTVLFQQLPVVIKKKLASWCDKKQNEYIYLDTESPIYVFTVSNESVPGKITWSEDSIKEYKKSIGKWTEIYSGSWPDYSDELYEKRVQKNLSNRLSELHFIRRNSGFIFMEMDNYEKFFRTYMMEYVLIPTSKIRAMLFALISIDESLDIINSRQRTEEAIDIKENILVKKNKLETIRKIDEILKEQMSFIYNELNYNRRQHYTAVLELLLAEFDIHNTFDRVTKKFESTYAKIHNLSLELNSKLNSSMNRLNFLIIASVFADIAQFIISIFVDKPAPIIIATNTTLSVGLTIFLIWVLKNLRQSSKKVKKAQKIRAVDAIINVSEPGDEPQIIIIERKNRPFKNKLALPGGFVRHEETPETAIIREVKEETNLDIKNIKKVAVFEWDKKSQIKSTCFLCDVDGGLENLQKGGDATSIKLMTASELEGLNLAFDHEDMIIKSKILDKIKK